MSASTGARDAWWRNYFDDAYFDLHDPLFEEQRSRSEASAIREMLGLSVDSRVLDAPCGWGRHTTLLAEAACDTFGADLSYELLAHAPTDTGARYTAADIRYLPY